MKDFLLQIEAIEGDYQGNRFPLEGEEGGRSVICILGAYPGHDGTACLIDGERKILASSQVF